MTFKQEIKTYRWDELAVAVRAKNAHDVAVALRTDRKSFEDLLALLSPAASDFIEEIAQAAHRLTVQRFGRIIQMYAPIYLSSECTNACVYCGFNHHNQIKRVTLTPDEVLLEAQVLIKKGFRHVLLLSGESPRHVSISYLNRVAKRLQPFFASLSLEIYPLETDGYRQLIANGVDGLTVYQETYDRIKYAAVHPAGRKGDYDWRLETPERGGRAGFRRLNIGALLGLADWRVEGLFLGLHARYLMNRYWKSHVSVSFPRLRPAAGGYQPQYPVTDADMVQLMCALRLWIPDAGLVLSTREPRELRDNLIPLGVTQMSAGSKTAPGGYAGVEDAEAQFAVNDERSPQEVARAIAATGYEPVWKDWDAEFLKA